MIQSHADGVVRVLTLDRPSTRNALTREGLEQLEACLAAATEPVVYLRGAGTAFCAGADLAVVNSLDRASAVAFAELGQRVAAALAEYSGAVVAGIDGPARGGGLELALACDLRVATPAATFAEPGVALGLFGAWGGTGRLPRIVGLGNAMDLSLSGRVIDAATARRMGLVSQVCERPRAIADEVATAEPGALRAVARLLREPRGREPLERAEAAAFGECIARSDGPIGESRG
ncbi:MAG: enoyl-CoA hydratase/carnithine racemase [halophilic archaeon J07HX5]|nr:MAG: enoyl-CoA hydratase/carnithine racemase [halophilic archaeon J07HX5]